VTGVDIDLQPLELAQMLLIWRYDVALEVSTITIAFTLSGITFVLSHFLIFVHAEILHGIVVLVITLTFVV
jgi:hypothetical protein